MTKYVELINKKVNALDATSGVPRVFEETIDATGYSEIRMFIHIFVDNYKTDPVTANSTIEANLFHSISGGSWPYSKREMKSNVTSYINGWFSEKIIGNKVRVIATAKNLPRGPYTISVTYLLV